MGSITQVVTLQEQGKEGKGTSWSHIHHKDQNKMRTTEHGRDLTLKLNTLCTFQNKFVLIPLKYQIQSSTFSSFPHLLSAIQSAQLRKKRRMERNSSLTAVHTLICMLCTQCFTVNWLGTELVWNFLTKLTFFIQQNAVAQKVSQVQVPFLTGDLSAHPNLIEAY